MGFYSLALTLQQKSICVLYSNSSGKKLPGPNNYTSLNKTFLSLKFPKMKNSLSLLLPWLHEVDIPINYYFDEIFWLDIRNIVQHYKLGFYSLNHKTACKTVQQWWLVTNCKNFVHQKTTKIQSKINTVHTCSCSMH